MALPDIVYTLLEGDKIMDTTIVKLRIFSPRWGHKDTYELRLSQDSMVITHNPKSAKCAWRDTLDPEWSGDNLRDILENDSICPPAKLEDLIEYAWVSWRNGELSDTDVNVELQAVADWINEITKAKPNTKFWRKYIKHPAPGRRR